MTVRQVIKNGQFWWGDCFDLLQSIPDESVDMFNTDPPYGMQYVSGRRRIAHRAIEGDEGVSWLPKLVKEMYRTSRFDTGHYVFCSQHFLTSFIEEIGKMFKIKNVLTWVKNNHTSGDLTGSFANKTEFVIFFTKGRPLIRGKRDTNVLEYAKVDSKRHPTEKPVNLVRFLIEKFSDPGDLVLDPFAGSGTTAVAAEQCGRRWICMEKDADYYIKAIHRTATS